LVGKSIGIIFAREEEDPFKKEVLKTLTEQEGSGYYEIRYRRKDAREISILFSISVVKDEAGAIDYVVCMGKDITSRNIMEEVLRREKEQLAFLNKIMSERETRVIELKKEINSLLEEMGRQKRYGE
jgi:hypothetical protein